MNLSKKCIDLYHAQYPDDHCGFEVPSGHFIIETGDTMYIQPESETEEAFMDRLERSIKAGRNLFCEEWETFEYDDDCEY